MTVTLASRRPYSASRAFWRVLARLTLVLVVGFILASIVGIVYVVYLATIVEGW